MTVFSGLPKPFYDETFSSWLHRVADQQFLDQELMLECIKKFAPDVQGDHDALYASPGFVSCFAEELRRGIRDAFVLPDAQLLLFKTSNVYCPRCLQEDIAADRAPGWRRSWRVQAVCVCLLHDHPVLLRRLEEPRFNAINKPWLAFQEYVKSPTARLQTDFAITQSFASTAPQKNRILLHLAARTQRWYSEVVSLGLEPRLSLKAARFLIYFWLWDDAYRQNVNGFARQYIRPLRGGGLSAAPRTGLGVQKIFERVEIVHVAVAFWMLGIGYGVISEKEAGLIQSYTYSRSTVFPASAEAVASAGRRCFSAETLAAIREEAVRELTEQEYYEIAWAIG
ncbi:TniQ family protein [Pseudomonas putida]|uniref:TniQ family protein n=1 Tax=Pseudomonas putida TaxID=303 RepID=UPI000E6AEB41|nr:TniQ family protein [Pseudomonas putida]RIZ40649.1 hypothetical protein CIK02_13560 [Pseudomonas putida]